MKNKSVILSVVESTLTLFGVVPEAPKNLGIEEPIIIKEHGVVISPQANWFATEIRQYLDKNKLTGNQLNASFYKSWNSVWDKTREEILIDQVRHYFSTYGLQTLGVFRPEYIYLPAETANIPETVKFKVIETLPIDEIISKSLTMLQSGVALKEETVKQLITLLVDLGYEFTGDEEIKNREAQILIADLSGVLPSNGDNLLRYLVYKATGRTEVVKNSQLFAEIGISGYALPRLTEKQKIELSKSFLRNKQLWLLGFRKTNKANRPIINKISKLARVYHKPVRQKVLLSLTSKEFDEMAVQQAAQEAKTLDLVKAANALIHYMMEPTNRVYKIRNGKLYPRKKDNTLDLDVLGAHSHLLLRELKKRVSSQKIYMPDYIDYAAPTSQKHFSGVMPYGTKVILPRNSDANSLLTGVYWTVGDDIDLSAIDLEGRKIGWNSDFTTSNNSVTYSGDMTYPREDGAVEWILSIPSKLETSYLLLANNYSNASKFKIVVALSKKQEDFFGYMADPNEIIFEADSEFDQRQRLVGLVCPLKDHIEFFLVDKGMKGGAVSSASGDAEIIRKNLVSGLQHQIRLRDLFTLADSPDEEDTIDLSPDKLSQDTILALFD